MSLLLLDYAHSFLTYRFEKDDTWLTHKSKKQNQQEVDEKQPKKDIVCAACQTVITAASFAIEMAGSHQHTFTNPEGISFAISLYSQANCQRHGPALLEYTWFPGYAWQLALCPQCHTHLGWRYLQPGSPVFYGLISDRLSFDK